MPRRSSIYTPRPILPRVPDATGCRDSTRQVAPTRKNVAVACESCRRAKLRCSAERPKCTICFRKGQMCVYRAQPSNPKILQERYGGLRKEYENLQMTYSNLEKLIHAMRTRNEHQASIIFQMIRQGVNPESIMQHIDTGDALVELHLATAT